MRGSRLRRVLAGGAVAVAMTATACGGASQASVRPVAGKDIKPLSDTLVPPEVNGLTVVPENISDTLASGREAFVDSMSLFSFRTGDKLLQATLQVSRFSEKADYRSAKFQQTVVGNVGSTTPKPFRVGSDTVYITTGKKQNIDVWFRGRYLFVLAVRDDYDQPRALLRKALEIRP